MNSKNHKRSPFFYVGDKYKLISQIKELFPRKIGRFYEPFMGGGTVFLNVEAKEYFLNDIDPNLLDIHKCLIQHSAKANIFFRKIEKLIKKFNLSRSYYEDIVPSEFKTKWKKTYYAKFNKENYIKMRSEYNSSKKKDPLLLYLLLIYGFNRMLRFNRSGKFNIPVGNVDFNTNTVSALNGYFEAVTDRKINLFNEDFKIFIEKQNFKKDDFVYIDPPYLITFSEYNKIWNEEQEKELLRIIEDLDKKGVNFALSNVTHYKGAENRLLISWLKDYNAYDIRSNYISYHNNSLKEIKEVLITNYDH
tara:strand:- start:5836 stop:6750 length:915 start_codon:yes stop_codon:yes gene_type:complete